MLYSLGENLESSWLFKKTCFLPTSLPEEKEEKEEEEESKEEDCGVARSTFCGDFAM